MSRPAEPAYVARELLIRSGGRTISDSGNILYPMSKIRREQMSHRKFLRRGRNVRALQYSLLFLAALAAAAGVWAAFMLPGLGADS